ncbi:L-threonylcarbamoyladenylate synthase [Mycoplasma simbae]|uniref:L-threonylcarbamoyladenylate synthase n=1 Tax=Mycoplasma simbae TaxID=36744 RepID=UPI0004964F51|nr:Sua5/YciO/YrdC/YwlC family protein [Mycoplasma simbae]
MANYDDLFITTTDTVCGLGGPINSTTLQKIYELKQRPLHKKIMILVGSIEQARQFKEWNEQADEFALQHWPGPYSVVVNDQGFRMPNQQGLIEFLLANGPMYVTSANISGQTPIDINQASQVFPQVKKVLNFGTPSGQASMIYCVETNSWIR